MIRSLSVVAVLAVLAVLGVTSAEAADAAANAVWRPAPHLRWQVQYSATPVDLRVEADVFKVDLFDVGARVVSDLKRRGKHVVCYLNVGAWEDWRPDKLRFPRATLGQAYEGWPGERWLDIRRIDLLAPVMLARLDLCRAKGFDGVLFDNIDNYMQKTGFPITATHQLEYVLWIAAEARRRGLAVGINNNPEQAGVLLPHVDWMQAESCFSQGWCASLTPFVEAGKPVVVIEYTDDPVKINEMCSEASALKVSLMVKKRELDAYRRECSERPAVKPLSG